MDVDHVLSHLVYRESCFPAIKLAWDSQFNVYDLTRIPKIFPSVYFRELQLNTNERHSLLCYQQRKLEFWNAASELMVVPCVLVFQRYTTGEKQSLNLSIRNISKNLQKVTLLMDESHAFEVDVNSTRIASFASGMTVTATVNFQPEDDRDYYHKLIITTKNSRFAIPILGIGGRGILDLPDQVDFKWVPVKYIKTILVAVCNIGSKCARFTLKADGPFCVSPEKGVVAPKDSFNLSVTFVSETKGCFEGRLQLKYENGEEVCSVLLAYATDEEISLSTQSIVFENTYTGFKSREFVRIINDSDKKLAFSWKKYPSKWDFDFIHDKKHINTVHDGDGDNAEFDNMSDHRGNDARMEPLFANSVFTIEPPVGKVQPKSYTDVQIFFSPDAPHSFNVEAYCDLIGREDRIALCISGRGLGPKFRLGFDELNVGTVFLGGSHTYEIPVQNISQISGEITFQSIMGHMANIVGTVEPDRLTLAPGQFGAFYVFFTYGGIPRDFFEELTFNIPLTNEFIYIRVSGTITFPGLHFSVKCLDFGNVSYGFPKSEQAVLINDSVNSIDIVLKMAEDGNEPALNYQQIISSFTDDEFQFPEIAQEFTIEPASFTIAPLGLQRSTVTLLSNKYCSYDRKINVYIADNLADPIFSLSVKAEALVPSLVGSRISVVLNNCFVGYSYSDHFEVYNPTDLSGVYCVVPKRLAKFDFESESFIGYFTKRSMINIPFQVKCREAGDTVGELEFYIVGVSDHVLVLQVTCSSIPAKLEISRTTIDFGYVELLEPYVQEFDVVNDTPIEMAFTTSLISGGKNSDKWVVTPAEDTIPPNSILAAKVTCTLAEPDVHSATLRVTTSGTSDFTDIKMKASGNGSNLVFNPNLLKGDTTNGAIIDFGSLFINTTKSFSYNVTNMGHKLRTLEWRSEREEPPLNSGIALVKSTKKKDTKDDKQVVKKKKSEIKKKPVLTIEPTLPTTVAPGKTITIVFSVNSATAQKFDENYILWTYVPNPKPKKSSGGANYGLIPQRQAIYKPVASQKVKVLANFEIPMLIFSKKSLLFGIMGSPMEQTFEEKASVRVTNGCKVPLFATFRTSFPFSILKKGVKTENEKNEWDYTFESLESICLTLKFDGRHLRKDHDTLMFESNLDTFYNGHSVAGTQIPLKGEVNFGSVVLDKYVIDFGVIHAGTEAMEELNATNQCKFPLTYKWYIKPFSTFVEPVREYSRQILRTKSRAKSRRSTRKLKVTEKPNKDAPSALDSTLQNYLSSDYETESEIETEFSSRRDDDVWYGEGYVTDRSLDMKTPYTPVSTVNNDVFRMSNSLQSLDNLLNYGPSAQYFREKLYRSRMMEMFGIQDGENDELEDELMYLEKNQQEPYTVGPGAVNELIDIVPMAGVIHAGETQKFTVVFYGQPGIRFKTVAICFIEGGSSRNVTIMGQSQKLKEDFGLQLAEPEKRDESPKEVLEQKTKKKSIKPSKTMSEFKWKNHTGKLTDKQRKETLDKQRDAIRRKKERDAKRKTLVEKRRRQREERRLATAREKQDRARERSTMSRDTPKKLHELHILKPQKSRPPKYVYRGTRKSVAQCLPVNKNVDKNRAKYFFPIYLSDHSKRNQQPRCLRNGIEDLMAEMDPKAAPIDALVEAESGKDWCTEAAELELMPTAYPQFVGYLENTNDQEIPPVSDPFEEEEGEFFGGLFDYESFNGDYRNAEGDTEESGEDPVEAWEGPLASTTMENTENVEKSASELSANAIN